MTISWWKTGVRLPEIGGTIQTQSAGHPPRVRSSFSMCFTKDSVAAWWSTIVTLATCGDGRLGLGLGVASTHPSITVVLESLYWCQGPTWKLCSTAMFISTAALSFQRDDVVRVSSPMRWATSCPWH